MCKGDLSTKKSNYGSLTKVGRIDITSTCTILTLLCHK